ncbi:MAG: polyhydroxyalkanoic acid system family protein [Myxococcales bacterium]|nr:polyhydroxyalkanoic acid system family protein [Myxococcales bacterium]MCB9714347.1 polyhydroxyalkanoic acid system family protein [Myxococcales bacterium]
MKYSVKHGLADTSRVRLVVEKAYSAYEERLRDYRPSIDWTGDQQAKIGFTVMSQSVSAELEFDEQELRIDGKVPFLFRPFQGKIESVLGREMDKWLEKARNGEI